MTARRAREAAILVLAAVSLGHFAFEVRAAHQNCCFDFGIFWDNVRGWAASGMLYPQADTLNEFLPGSATYKFPPFYAAILALFLGLGIDGGVYVFQMALQIALYLAAVALLLATLGARRTSDIALAYALAFNFGPFFETLWRLQPETWILFLLTAALFLLARGHEKPAGAALGLAAMLKLYPAALLAYFVITRRRRAVEGFVLGAAAAALIGLAVFGAFNNGVYFGHLLPFMSGEAAVDGFGSEGMGLPRYLDALLGLDPVAAKRTSMLVVAAAFALTGGVAVAARSRARTVGIEVLAFAAFVPLTLQLLPNAWANYQVLLLLPLLAVVLVRAAAGGPHGPLLLAATAYVLCLYHQQMSDMGWPRPGGRDALFESWQTLRGIGAPWLSWVACLWSLRRAG